MRLLLDTQIAIWWQIAPHKIAPETESLIRKRAAGAWISRASLWQMAIKIGLGKLRIDLATFIRHVENDGFKLLPITDEHILTLVALPAGDDHKDPFDRLLVAQSIAEPLTLVTADRKLAQYGPTVRVV